MNKKSKGTRTHLKRSLPHSEEDLSDRRSSSSSTDSNDKTNKMNERQPSTRRTPQKKKRYNFDFIESQLAVSGSDGDWNLKASNEEGSSDSDPAWSPKSTSPLPTKAKTVSTKPKKTSPVPPEESKVNHQEATDEIKTPLTTPTDLETSPSFVGLVPITADVQDKGFESGKFIMLKTDLKTQKPPCIWRIDGKNLLQKYEAVQGGSAYRNISTYSSWMAVNKGLYVSIDVNFTVQSKSETIVTFDRTKVMLPLEQELYDSINEEATAIMDTFQIYLQTLISQALDSNFLNEIVKESDEYFLSSIEEIETQWIAPRIADLKEIIKLKKPFQELLEAHPKLELRCVTSGDKSCDTCNGRNPTRSFEFLLETYNVETLKSSQSKASSKNYRLCLSCTDRVLLYHQLFHIRYHLFLSCQAKLKEYSEDDGPAALTACLADQNWKQLMHQKVVFLIAEAQQVINIYTRESNVRT